MKTHNVNELIDPSSELFRILKKLPKLSKEGPWVAGGSIWKSMEKMPLTCDIDFFFKDESQVKEMFSLMKSMPYARCIIEEKRNKFNTTFRYHINEVGYNKTISIQFISFKHWPTPKALIDDFDFTVCQFLYDGECIHTGEDSISHLKERRIIFNKICRPTHTLYHLKKYLNKGFTISEDQQKILDDATKSKKNFLRNEETDILEEVADDDDWTNYNNNVDPAYEVDPLLVTNGFVDGVTGHIVMNNTTGYFTPNPYTVEMAALPPILIMPMDYVYTPITIPNQRNTPINVDYVSGNVINDDITIRNTCNSQNPVTNVCTIDNFNFWNGN